MTLMSERGETLRYLPGLDGLRAVAVLAVMLYHGGVGSLSGGFLGVDVFFALSGFLITSLLLAEWDRTGRVRLGAFWARRARRLLPALVVVILAVVAWAALVADAAMLARVRTDGLASLFYVSNWAFVIQGQSYFDQFTVPSPFRHTWSLAIEEQFYLVFPFVFIAAMTVLRRRRWVSLLFGLGALLSAALMAVLLEPGTDPSRAYYGTDTRLQTLLVGAALAAATAGRGVPGWLRRISAVISLVGAAVLVVAFLRVSETSEWMYQGGFLVVAIASAAVISGVAFAPASPVNRVLSLRPLVAIGVISYGLYLWHWPVFLALTPARVGLSGWSLFLLRVLVTAVIAAASYRFVEQPIRQGGLSALRPAQRAGAVVATGVAAVAVLFAGTMGAQAVTNATTARDVQGSGATRVFFLGDSQAFGLRSHFTPSIDPGLSVTGSTQLGCGLRPVTMYASGKVINPAPMCFEWEARRETELAAAPPDIGVLFAGSWEQFDTQVDGTVLPAGSPEWRRGLVDYYTGQLQMLARHSEHTAIMLNHCHLTPDVGIGPEPGVVNDQARVELVNAAAREAAAASGVDVEIIDINEFLCSNGFEGYRDGVLMRVDGLHFTPEGADIVWRWLAPQLRSIASGG